MGKRLSLAAAIGVLFAVLPVAPAVAMDELQSCVQSSTVCFYDGASIRESEEVSKVLEGKARVAVVPNDDSNSLNPNQLAAQVAQATGTKELILVVDMGSKDRFGVYSDSGRGDEILEALNGTQKTDGGEAIVAADLGSVYSAPVTSGDAGGGFSILSLAIPLVIVVALIGGAIAFVRKRSGGKQKAVENQPTAVSIREQRAVEISEDLRRELTNLGNAAERYGRASDPVRREASGLINTAVGHIYELFRRIDKKKASQNREIAQIRYLAIARKLNSTLSKDYFEDIVKNPGLWDNSHEKVAAVLTALKSVDYQIIENIKQVNSSKELEFKIAVDSLIGTDAATVDQAFGNDDGSMSRKISDPFRR